MNSIMKDLLLVQSVDLGLLIEKYRLFFLGLLPSVFLIAVIVEYFDRLEPFTLVKRAFISIIILSTITSFYTISIDSSMSAADEVMRTQLPGNILMMDMFDGVKERNQLRDKEKKHDFFKENTTLGGVLSFLKHNLFDAFVNDSFTITIFFITKLCFLILKVVYSLVYYLGYGLIGIPCLIYLFPSMGNVLRGAVLSFLWCLVVPHLLVFVISMIGSEINRGYVSGQIIGGSMMGTALLFILTLFVAFTPLIGAMILNGSGISQAGGIIATIGANYVMNLPKNTLNTSAALLTGGSLGPKMMFAKGSAGASYSMAKRAKNIFSNTENFKESELKLAPQEKGNSKPKSHQLQNTTLSDTRPRDHAAKNTFKADYRDLPKKMTSKNSKSLDRANPNKIENTLPTKRRPINGELPKHGKINRRAQETPRLHRHNKPYKPPFDPVHRHPTKQRE